MLRKDKKYMIIIYRVYCVPLKSFSDRYGHKNEVIRWLIS